MRVLITGGFGYLGGRVAKYLAVQGYDVVLGSRSQKRVPDWLPEATVVQLHWDDEHALKKICSNVDVVIHTAGMNAQDCALDPVSALDFNGVATARLARASKNSGVIRFIYFSTAHVYRSPLEGVIDENTCPQNMHPYATSHLAGEYALQHIAMNASDLVGIVIRLSNAIGYPMSVNTNCWNLYVNDIVKDGVINKKITIKGDPNQQRDFIAINNLCLYIHTNLLTDISAESRVINIGSGESRTLISLAMIVSEAVEKVCGYKPDIVQKTNTSLSNKPLKYSSNYLCSESRKYEAKSQIEDEIIGLVKFVSKYSEELNW